MQKMMREKNPPETSERHLNFAGKKSSNSCFEIPQVSIATFLLEIYALFSFFGKTPSFFPRKFSGSEACLTIWYHPSICLDVVWFGMRGCTVYRRGDCLLCVANLGEVFLAYDQWRNLADFFFHQKFSRSCGFFPRGFGAEEMIQFEERILLKRVAEKPPPNTRSQFCRVGIFLRSTLQPVMFG